MLTKATLIASLMVLLCHVTLANDYENAWKAIHKNDLGQAKTLLKSAMNDPVYGADAYSTFLFIKSFEQTENKETGFMNFLYHKVKDPNPYVFALWFNGAVLGNYGKKSNVQLQNLEKILSDKNSNGSIKAAGRYVMAWHLQASNKMDLRLKEYEKMGGVGPAWQLAGPFDNLSGSGFNKEFGPLEHPEPGATFKAHNNAAISWFTPTVMDKDGWTFLNAHILKNTAVVYAQCFVYAPKDMKLLLNAGLSGAGKIWVNDAPVISVADEFVTELDYYKNYADLKKGYNRLLVKLAYTDNEFPNFMVRFTNDQYEPVEGLKFSSETQPYAKSTSLKEAEPSIKHFAEAFFEEKIKENPSNIINHLLLNEVYLRNQKTVQSRTIMEKLVQQFPDNPLVRYSLITCYIKEKNRTMMVREVERLKEKNPNSALVLQLDIDDLMETQKYDEVEAQLKKFSALFEEDDEIFENKVRLLSAQNKMDELVKLIEDAYKNKPDNRRVVELMYNVKTKAYQDLKGGIEVYENYMKNNYDHFIYKGLSEAYQQQGMPEKQLKVLESISKNFSYDGEQVNAIALHYFKQQNYAKAIEAGKQALGIAPYSATYWENLGYYYQNSQKKSEAIDAFKKAIYYNANKYTAREKVRELQNNPSLWKSFPEYNIDNLIKQAPDTIKDYDYYYLLNEHLGIIYPEGASEELNTLIVKVLNQKGIDSWKENSISYNSNSSYLIIEKAEAIKKNGVKTPAEQNNNEVVFTGLEVGDVVVIRYKLQHYLQGRLSSHYWNKLIFSGFVPQLTSRYAIMAANNVKLNHKTLNVNLPPKITRQDDYTLYNWQMDNIPAYKSEPYMPTMGDVGSSITVSTIPDWGTVANWYSDLASKKMEEDFDTRQAFNSIFPDGTGKLKQKEIAAAIYNYIEKNIRYSSVSFRQSAYLPQKPSTTLNTGLGDCKDLSVLFSVMAKMAGIKSNLVLVSTRDYGQKSMELPAVEFNHCIVKTWLDGTMYYIELTDNNLPFGSLPTSLYKALSLTIPDKSDANIQSQLELITSPARTRDVIRRRTALKINNDDLEVKTDVTKSGALGSDLRYTYSELSHEKQLEEMEKSVSGKYKNSVALKDVYFKNINQFSDSLLYGYQYTVQNEVSEVGSMNMFKLPFEDMVATVDNFSANQRKFPVEYWRYEDVDEYETSIEIEIPATHKFIELPKNQSFTFNANNYKLEYTLKSPNRLIVARKASLQKEDVPAAQYEQMKTFLSNIVKAEAKYIAFSKK